MAGSLVTLVAGVCLTPGVLWYVLPLAVGAAGGAVVGLVPPLREALAAVVRPRMS